MPPRHRRGDLLARAVQHNIGLGLSEPQIFEKPGQHRPIEADFAGCRIELQPEAGPHQREHRSMYSSRPAFTVPALLLALALASAAARADGIAAAWDGTYWGESSRALLVHFG